MAERPTVPASRQYLPVPIGDMRPVHRSRGRPVVAALATWVRPMVLVVGIANAAVGAALLWSHPEVSASLTGAGIQVGSMSLHRVGDVAGTELFAGASSFALRETGLGSASAAAAWTHGGIEDSGSCSLRRQSAILLDECTFTFGTSQLTAVDVMDPARGSTWQRTYSDGVRVAIDVSADGAAIPVPFPIGH